MRQPPPQRFLSVSAGQRVAPSIPDKDEVPGSNPGGPTKPPPHFDRDRTRSRPHAPKSPLPKPRGSLPNTLKAPATTPQRGEDSNPGGPTDREWAYVAMSRGRQTNTVYLTNPQHEDEQCTHLTHQGRHDALDGLTAALNRARPRSPLSTMPSRRPATISIRSALRHPVVMSPLGSPARSPNAKPNGMQPNGRHQASASPLAVDHNHGTWQPNIWDRIGIAGSSATLLGLSRVLKAVSCAVPALIPRLRVVLALRSNTIPDRTLTHRR